MLFRLGNVTNWLDVTQLPPPPFYFISSKTWLLSNIQQTYMNTYTHIHTRHTHTPHTHTPHTRHTHVTHTHLTHTHLTHTYLTHTHVTYTHITHSDVRSADNAWYHIEENFRWRKLFWVCDYIHESFFRKIWGHLLAAPASIWLKFFAPIRESFLQQKFPALQYWLEHVLHNR